jgi:hypothetical protein
MEIVHEKSKPINWKFTLLISSFCIAVFLFFSLFFLNYSSYDGLLFRAVAKVFISGQSPYSIQGFYNPPWALLPIIPLIWFPGWFADGLLTTINAVCILAVAWKRGARGWLIPLVLLAPCVIAELRSANITGITALGVILPPQIGLFFVLSKPQAGAAVVIFWLAEAWRRGKLREVFKIFAPVSIAYSLSLLIYSPNLIDALKAAPGIVGLDAYHNATLWPYGTIIGIPLLIYAIRKHDIGPAILSSACFSPYIGFYSWPIALLGLLPDQTMLSFVSLAMWIPAFLKGHY